MIYLLDTVTVVRHFTGLGKIGKYASDILNNIEQSQNEFVISIISLMEIMYLSEKKRIGIDLNETYFQIKNNKDYDIIDLNFEIIQTASNIQFYELHDRIILATAKWLGIPVISSDKQFQGVSNIEVIWD